MKKPLKDTLSRQLISLAVIMVLLIFIGLGIILPKSLLPFYEKTIYQTLKEPLEVLGEQMGDDIIDTDIAYIYVTNHSQVIATDNLKDIIKLNIKQILTKIDSEYGKFNYLGKTYYYYRVYSENFVKISLTDDRYIMEMREGILNKIFPIIAVILVLICLLIIFWSRKLVKKIEHLKEKIEHIGDDTYEDTYEFEIDDELKLLSEAIDQMKRNLKEQEEYKNQMYQNISHDFKTPLTVMKSYIEAIEDGVEDPKEGFGVIRNQVDKLESKVHSLLYLNKLNYIKDLKNYKNEQVDVSEVIRTSVEKFKIQKPTIKWEIRIDDKKTIFRGTYDMWEAIVDNILNNFIRYAESKIKITMKGGRITFYNDGENIDESILDDIFTPYKKGMQGQFGLGLSIVKKSVALMGYEVTVKNEKKGISFLIK